MVLALSSCSGLLERFESIGGSLLDTSKTENGVAQGEYTPGTVTDSDWKSAWIGLQYTLTDGFSMMSQEELEELMDFATGIYKDPETGKELIDYAKVNAIYEMQAMDNMGNNVIVMAEKVNFLINSEEKLQFPSEMCIGKKLSAIFLRGICRRAIIEKIVHKEGILL